MAGAVDNSVVITSAKASTLGPGPAVLAVDVGGTQIKAAVLDRDGRLTGVTRRPTPRSATDPGGAVVEAAIGLLDGLRSDAAPIGAIGISVPGIVDESSGRGLWSANLGWRDYPFGHVLTSRTGLPAAVVHDVRAAGEAEARLGAARGVEDAAIVAIGTGIAAALRIGGRAYTGRGYAGELGHVVVDPSGPPCSCGRTGCLEAISSAAAILRRYQERGTRPAGNAAEVLSLAARGDAVAGQVWNSATAALGAGLGLLVAIMAPQVIVLGGGLAEAGAALFDPVREELTARCSGLSIPQLVKAELGEDAGTWGAAILARNTLLHPAAGKANDD
jgi:glucokinase